MKDRSQVVGALLMATLALVMATTRTAGAQEVKAAPVTPSETQIQLYGEGAQAFKQEDYPKAIRLFKASLDLGELNITYLNLGRAYFKSGDCREAARLYEATLKAPRVAEPTFEQVEAKVKEYQQDLQTQCDGLVVVQCDPGTMTLEFDGEAGGACRAEAWPLKPGRHVILGQLDGKTAVTKVDVVAMQEATVTLKIEGASVGGGPVEPKPASGGIDGKTWGLITAGAGGAFILGGLIYDAAVLAPKFEEYEEAAAAGSPEYDTLKSELETGQTVELVLIGVGVAGVVAGGLIYFLSDDEAAPGSAQLGVTPLIGPDSAGVGVLGSW